MEQLFHLPVQRTSGKDIPLEALRGLAALCVLMSHVVWTFYPDRIQLGFEPSLSLRGTPWFVFVNGLGAVNLFFVLSGYVLTRRYFLTGNDDIILRGAIKRWPRLMGPVLITVIFSWALFATGSYHFHQAAELLNNPLLSNDLIAETADHYTLQRALLQGTVLTFFRGDKSFNSALWTMQPEFIGSFLAFGLAFFVIKLKGRSILAAGLIFVVVTIICHYSNLYLVAFTTGVALAFFAPVNQKSATSLAACVLVFSLYLLGYSGDDIGIYSGFGVSPLFSKFPDYVNTCGAVLIVWLAESCPPLRYVLSNRLMARVGEMSFPVYLVHVPIICSAGAAAFITFSALNWPHAKILALSLSVLLSLGAAVPLLIFNRQWLRFVNKIPSLLLSEKSPARAGAGVKERPREQLEG